MSFRKVMYTTNIIRRLSPTSKKGNENKRRFYFRHGIAKAYIPGNNTNGRKNGAIALKIGH
jgi:hypothetical protein